MKIFMAVVTVIGMTIGTAYAEAVDALFVEYDATDSGYQFIDARMDETGAAGAFFGLVGAAVNSAHNISQDDVRGAQFEDAAASLDIEMIVRESFLATLDGRDITVLNEPDRKAHRLLIEVGDWGLRRRSRTTDEMRAYVNVRMVLRDGRGRELERKIINRVGDVTSADLEVFSNGVFEAEVRSAAHHAGRQIAYDLIYR